MIAHPTDGGFLGMPPLPEGPVEILLRRASTVRPFRSVEGHLYVLVPAGDREQVYALWSPEFRHWLLDGCRFGADDLPKNGAIRSVLTDLEDRARFDHDGPSVHVRVGPGSSRDEPAYYLDLGDTSGRAIKIAAEGWTVVDRPGAHFRRPAGLLPLPTPGSGGSIELLRPYVNLGDSDFRLLVAWIAAALGPTGPYPILAIYGEQGSAKSTLAKIVRRLIDPQSCSLLAEPKNERDLAVTAFGGWLLSFDNISAIPVWLSDCLCRLSTGGGFAIRGLYTDDERRVLDAQRPVIVNGIEEFVRRGDLADRAVFLHLAPIEPINRLTESEFWESFELDYPMIVGGVLDSVVGGLRELPSVRLKKPPRLADFATFGEAIGRSVGWPDGAFLTAYSYNRMDAAISTLEDSLVARALVLLARPVPKQWTGTAASLHVALAKIVGKKNAASASWPKTCNRLGNELRRVAPQLRMYGVSVTFERTRKGRSITVTSEAVPKSESTRANPGPVSSSADEISGDTPVDTRNSNDGNMIPP
jgi:hypothetical protein